MVGPKKALATILLPAARRRHSALDRQTGLPWDPPPLSRCLIIPFSPLTLSRVHCVEPSRSLGLEYLFDLSGAKMRRKPHVCAPTGTAAADSRDTVLTSFRTPGETLTDTSPSRAPLDAEASRRLHQAIMAGLPNGKRVLELHRIESLIDEAEDTIGRICAISAPDRINGALAAIAAAAWSELPNDPAPPQDRLPLLWRAWLSGEMPDAQRRPYERFLTASGLQRDCARALRGRPRTAPPRPTSPPLLIT